MQVVDAMGHDAGHAGRTSGSPSGVPTGRWTLLIGPSPHGVAVLDRLIGGGLAQEGTGGGRGGHLHARSVAVVPNEGET